MMMQQDYHDTFENVRASSTLRAKIAALETEKAEKRTPAIGRKVLLAAAIVSLLVLTVSATGFSSKLLAFFASRSEQQMDEGLVDILETGIRDLNIAHTIDGYTIEADTAITDGRTAFFLFHITAPENVNLYEQVQNGDTLELSSINVSSSALGEQGTLWTIADDGDAMQNTMDLVCRLQSVEGALSEENTVSFRFDNLSGNFLNETYASELKEKFGYVPKMIDPNLTEQDYDAERLYQTLTIASGLWEFKLNVQNCTALAVEFVHEPVSCTILYNDQDTLIATGTPCHIDLSTRLLSVKVTPLGLTAEFDKVQDGCYPTNPFTIVMKDGSTVEIATSISVAETQLNIAFDTPIDPSQIDHLALSDGTNLYLTAE